MHTSHDDSVEQTAAQRLGEAIRNARKTRGLTIAQLSDSLGRPREWLNRVELGYSDQGVHKPPSQAELKTLTELLGTFRLPAESLLRLGAEAEQEFDSLRRNRRPTRPASGGKLTQAEIIIGENAVTDAIIDLIDQQHSDAVIRNTGIRGLGSYMQRSPYWNRYRERLGRFLAENPNGIFKRVEYVANNAYLELSKDTDTYLAGGRKLEDVHNARVKFRKQNPLSLHLLIGQREAILAIPHSGGQPGSNVALLVRDKLFVESLRLWFDEILWEGNEPSHMVDYSRFEESFQEIKKMYGFKD